ncbi:MAG TPA: NADH-quinone oxidoreductase subunit NuoH [Firmicutes bacterium]|nr:NADH-quinone oxidoreductase subunit NuoH [Bacillota bacterium]
MNALIVFIKIALGMVALLLAAAYMTLYERRLVAAIQDRIGPNRVGWQGVLQPIADGIKVILKEDIVPEGADPLIHGKAPFLAVLLCMAALAIIPIGDRMSIAGYDIPLFISNAGILFFLAISSLSVYTVILAGWGSGNKFSMYGALRSAAQIISYELPMGLAVLGAILLWGSLSLVDIVNAQGLGNLREIAMFLLSIPFIVVFFITTLAETNRAPFDLPECENELVAGYHTEYTGLKFAMFYLAEYANIIVASAITTTLFLGGWKGPGFWNLGNIPVLWFALKTFALCSLFVWIRATFPRFRYDQLMDFGWKFLLPFTFIWVIIVAVVVAIWPA